MIFFFVGTEAELIKLFPVFLECRKQKTAFRIIASGQNDIAESSIFSIPDCGQVDLALSREQDIKKSASGLLAWWLKTFRRAPGMIRRAFPGTDFKSSFMIVHGDTVSTYMGARIGRRLNMRVAHIEAGLRSHRLLNPFPEEIDRLLTSRLASVHFAPGAEASANLRGKRHVVDTKANTLADSLRFSLTVPVQSEEIRAILAGSGDYAVFVLHRQENLSDRKLVQGVTSALIQVARDLRVVFLLHTITRNALQKYGLLHQLTREKNILLLDRTEYFDFMKLLAGSRFVVTDGGSNQEELYYMGKPTLLLRRVTERREGLGENARLFGGDVSMISRFAKDYEHYTRPPAMQSRPSRLIASYMAAHFDIEKGNGRRRA